MEFHFRGRQAEGDPRPPLFLFGAEDGKSCRWTGAGAQPLGSGKWARATPIVCPKESPLVRPQAHTLFCWGLPRRLRREQWGLPPYGALTLFFRWRKKSVQKKASGTATPEAARPASRYSQISAFRALPCPALVFAQACQSLTAYGSCAHWARAPSRPKLRSAGAERLDAPNLFGASNSGR